MRFVGFPTEPGYEPDREVPQVFKCALIVVYEKLNSSEATELVWKGCCPDRNLLDFQKRGIIHVVTNVSESCLAEVFPHTQLNGSELLHFEDMHLRSCILEALITGALAQLDAIDNVQRLNRENHLKFQNFRKT